jgi:hypothetical protein
MNRSSRPSVTRINELQQQIALLANLRPAAGAVVSCYLDLGQEKSMLQSFVRNRLGAELARVPAAQRGAFEACIDVIEAQLESDLPLRARGLAIFAAADGKAPLLSAMPFAVPFRRSLTVSRSPDLLPLVQLKELYGRFLIVMAEPQGLQLAEVNLGDVSVKVWATSSAHPVTDPAGGHSPLQAPRAGGLFSQVSLIERHLGKAGSCPVFLAGDVDVMQAIPELLGSSSVARLMGALPMPADATLHETAAECLRTLVDFETSQARSTAAQVLRQIRNQGHAVAGTAAVLDAIRNGIADRLVISSDYRPEPRQRYSMDQNDDLSLRVELIRLAAQQRFPVEFADSEALHYLGGVGCLLRDEPQALAQPTPPRYGSLDLVA